MNNSTDRAHINASASDTLEGLTSLLPILKTGEAIVLGESVKLPMRIYIKPPNIDKRPDSQDPIVFDTVPEVESMVPGGWGTKMESNPNYKEFLEVWRSQNPLPKRVHRKKEGE